MKLLIWMGFLSPIRMKGAWGGKHGYWSFKPVYDCLRVCVGGSGFTQSVKCPAKREDFYAGQNDALSRVQAGNLSSKHNKSMVLPAKNPPFDRCLEPHIMGKQDRTKRIRRPKT